MTRDLLDPFALHLLDAYQEAAESSRDFAARVGGPRTTMAKVHEFRSILLVRLMKDDRFEVCSEYQTFGRVSWRQTDSNRLFLLRSAAAITISHRTLQMFDAAEYHTAPETLVVHTFHSEGVDLATASGKQLKGAGRIVASSSPVAVATWRFADAGTGATFQQGPIDPFGELGALDDFDDVAGE